MALIKLCRPQMETDNTSVLERIRNLERQLAEGVVIAQQTGSAGGGSGAASGAPVQENKMLPEDEPAKAAPEDVQRAASMWKSIAKDVYKRQA